MSDHTPPKVAPIVYRTSFAEEQHGKYRMRQACEYSSDFEASVNRIEAKRSCGRTAAP